MGKELLFFSLILLSFNNKAQVIQRFSDGKLFDSITVVNAEENVILTSLNFRTFNFNRESKVLYNGKQIDFSIQNDTLVFFDKVKEIEAIKLSQSNLKEKQEKIIKKSNHKNFFYVLNSNYPMGTSINFDTEKKTTYIKSVYVFPELKNKEILNSGKMEIQILPNKNGLPNEQEPLSTFEINTKEIKGRIWEIKLPKIIKYPENGFFIIFKFIHAKNNVFALSLKTTEQSNVWLYNPVHYGGWKKDDDQGILYKLKILQ
ncbi:hypothetical protein [Chryseobacterium echinoideorum]|uniref:hypothetical protein n=1 Tax=Chryseobacterium echinoideorum TaxID=1549648 RepID=UPI00162A55D6|nr:hypothetical protein [Chryseobacterium echinoideorum]